MENEIRSHLEELGLSGEQIDSVLPLLVDKKEVPPHGMPPSSVEDLRNLLLIEPDYKKRAAIAARIISINLERGY